LPSFFKRVFKRIPATPRSFISGYGGVSILVDEAHILALAVLPSCRRQGIGEQILRRLIDTARRGGATLLTLEVRASNNAAQHLYRKYGFLPVGHRPGYYADTGEDAIIMTVEPVPHLP
jgi:ribosomal-protein-alanine N-acetyltransferase